MKSLSLLTMLFLPATFVSVRPSPKTKESHESIRGSVCSNQDLTDTIRNATVRLERRKSIRCSKAVPVGVYRDCITTHGTGPNHLVRLAQISSNIKSGQGDFRRR